MGETGEYIRADEKERDAMKQREPDTINMERARGTMRYHMQQMKQPDKR